MLLTSLADPGWIAPPPPPPDGDDAAAKSGAAADAAPPPPPPIDPVGNLCLHHASRHGNLIVCRMLLRAGAQVDARNKLGQ